MKKANFVYSFVLVLSFFFLLNKVSANTINDINMDVFIDENGNALVKEVWQANLTEGTEGFREFSDLNQMSITNFSVVDDSGKTYETVTPWDIDATFNEKAYKSGINYKYNGLELCWGISKRGHRTYTLSYNIDNLITQYTDNEGLYFNFLNLDQPVGHVKMTIHSAIPFSKDNARIWGLGYDGTANFIDGGIVLETTSSLSSRQYIVGLVRFETPLFKTTNTETRTFDEVYDEAFKDVERNNYSYEPSTYHMSPILFIFCAITELIVIFFPVLLINDKTRTWLLGAGIPNNRLVFGKSGKTLPKTSDIPYWREIPCDKDLAKAYWVCKTYNITTESTLSKGIVGAIFLKWIKDKEITVIKTKKGFLHFKDDNYAIDLNNIKSAETEIENDFLQIILKAAGKNKILEPKEFYKWSKKHYYEINNWLSDIITKEEKYLENEGLITRGEEKVKGSFGKIKTITTRIVDPSLKEEAIKMAGLKKFLLDFSKMPEREHFEVHIWEEYLMFAELMGIAKKVAEQFSKLYPSIYNQAEYDIDFTTNIIFNLIDDISVNCYNGVRAGVTAAQSHDYSGSDSWSGGGGSSFSSGGSSSGGSSGGGFR